MRAPSIKTLHEAFPNLHPCVASEIRKLVRNVDDKDTLAHVIETSHGDTHKWRMSCYGDPINQAFSRREIVLHAIDRMLGTYGVEALGPSDNDPHFVSRYQYCNAGDPYVATLIYKRDTDNLFVGCWGNIVEREDRKGTW